MKKLLILIILFIPTISYSYDIDSFYYTEDVEDSVRLNDTEGINNSNNLNTDENVIEVYDESYNNNSNNDLNNILDDIEILDYDTDPSKTTDNNINLKNHKNLQDDNKQDSVIINDDINSNFSDNINVKDKIDTKIINNNEKKLDNEIQMDVITYETIGNTNPNRFVNTASIRFLDKITAKSTTKLVKIGEREQFNKLIVLPLKCWKSYPEEMPENKLLIKVFKINKNKEKKMIFYGWIFSSTPSISGIEHPMYDITLEDCSNLEYDIKLQGNIETN